MINADKNVFVTMITPFYNTPFLLFTECLNSVKRQEYRCFEWIIIDDGSEDVFKDMLDALEEEVSEIKVCHQTNQGPSAARNVGIREANGEYIVFLDSDDTISEDYLAEMVNSTKDNEPDIILSNVIMCNGKHEVIDEKRNGRGAIIEVDDCNKKELLKKMFDSNYSASEFSEVYLSGFVTCKMIRAELAKKVLFDVKLMNGEDQVFMADCLLGSHRIATTNSGYYCYVLDNSDSITHSYSSRTIQYTIDYLKRVESFFEKGEQGFFSKLLFQTLRNLTGVIYMNCNRKKCINEYKKIFGDAYVISKLSLIESIKCVNIRERLWRSLLRKKKSNSIYLFRFIVDHFSGV